MSKDTSAGDTVDLAAKIAVSRQKIHKAVVRRIWELSDGGLDIHEIASVTGYPVHLVRFVLRGGSSVGSNGPTEKRSGLKRVAPR